jgi:hypothetical protein
MTHIPTPPDTDVPPIEPDHQEGAFTNCECTACREFRLADERIVYTAHEMADAWSQGWHAGYQRRIKHEQEDTP